MRPFAFLPTCKSTDRESRDDPILRVVWTWSRFPWEGICCSLCLRLQSEWKGNQDHAGRRGRSARMQSQKSLDLLLQWNVCSSVDPQRLKTAHPQYATEKKLKYKKQIETFPPDVLSWEAFNEEYAFEVTVQVIPVLSRLGDHSPRGSFGVKLDFLVCCEMRLSSTSDMLQLLTENRTRVELDEVHTPHTQHPPKCVWCECQSPASAVSFCTSLLLSPLLPTLGTSGELRKVGCEAGFSTS